MTLFIDTKHEEFIISKPIYLSVTIDAKQSLTNA